MKGAGEIGFTIVSLTVSLIAVLIPLLFMQEVVGRLFREFAVTLGDHHPDLGGGVADPGADAVRQAACAAIREEQKRETRVQRITEKYYDRVIAEYDRLLIWVLEHQPLHHAGGGGHPGADGAAVYRHPQGLLPAAGHRLHPGHHRRPVPPCPSTRWRSASSSWPPKILQDTDVASLSSFIGVDGTNNTLNSGRFLINLKPKDDRDGVTTIMNRLAQRRPFGAGHHVLSAAGAGPDHRFDRSAAPSISSCCRRRPRPISEPVRAQAAGRSCSKAPALRNVSTAYLDSGLSAYPDRGPRHRGAVRHHRRHDRQCAL